MFHVCSFLYPSRPRHEVVIIVVPILREKETEAQRGEGTCSRAGIWTRAAWLRGLNPQPSRGWDQQTQRPLSKQNLMWCQAALRKWGSHSCHVLSVIAWSEASKIIACHTIASLAHRPEVSHRLFLQAWGSLGPGRTPDG